MSARRDTRLHSFFFALLAGGAIALSGGACGPKRPQATLQEVEDHADFPPDTMFADDSLNLRPPQDTIRAITPEREDCDQNGVADAIDIRQGTEEDANRNGVIDPCDPDTSLLAHPLNTGWRAYRLAADTSYFWAGYQNRPVNDGGELVAIRYTVPRDGAAVRLDVYDVRGHEVATLVNERQESGFYESTWSMAGVNGKPLPPGMYRMRLRVDDRAYVRRVRWAR